MILTCTACSTRYLVDPKALGAMGRTVRCARCAHTWHQEPPPDAPLSVELPMVIAAESPTHRIQLPALREPPRRTEPAASWALVALIIVSIGIGALWARDSVASLWPAASRLYALVGLPAAVPGSGLDLRIATTVRGMQNGVPALIVDGMVANVSAVARQVPKLRVVLRDNDEHELKERVVAVTGERLLPGASVPFHATLDEPPEAATQVAVTFARDGN